MSWILRIFFPREDKHPEFHDSWRSILEHKVTFYRSLNTSEKQRFEQSVLHFLNTTKITGIQTPIDITDKLLVASGAIIPIFSFPDWEYINLHEVFIYPEHFDENHNIGSKNKAIFGMVGYGYLNGKMVISKKALHHGFSNDQDKRNTVIHEFVHLIDKMDGRVDGIMVYLKERSYVIPWLNLIEQKIEEIRESESDIDTYGATNHAEFMAVISEYFFERPKLLKKKHPELYHYLSLMFQQDLSNRKFIQKGQAIRRFDPCPCGSGKKFKDCCMKN